MRKGYWFIIMYYIIIVQVGRGGYTLGGGSVFIYDVLYSKRGGVRIIYLLGAGGLFTCSFLRFRFWYH